MSVVISGTGSISGLSNVGGISSAQSGSVIQTLSVLSTSQATTTTTSYVSTGHSVSITPQFSTSKILVMAVAPCYVNMAGGSQGGGFTIYRNLTNLSASNGVFAQIRANGFASDIVASVAMTYLDSPATTSSTTYTVYIESMAGATTTWNSSAGALVNNGYATITVMEIAA